VPVEGVRDRAVLRVVELEQATRRVVAGGDGALVVGSGLDFERSERQEVCDVSSSAASSVQSAPLDLRRLAEDGLTCAGGTVHRRVAS